MSNPRCVFNVASALSRVFIAPIEHCPTRFLGASNPSCPSLFNKVSTAPIQYRTYFKATSNAVAATRLPRDKEIRAPYLRLKNSDHTLDPPRSTAEILESIDLKTHTLEVITMGEYGEDPIAKILNKKEMFQQKQAQKKTKKPGSVIKTIEMNWAIDKNDLGHRLSKIRDFLVKGNKVEVLLAGKSKGRKATMEEAEAVVKRIRDSVEEVEGAKESRKMEGKLLAPAVLYFVGKEPKN